MVLSVEEGRYVENIKVHDNLVFDNAGSGLFFSRWGADTPRRNIEIYNNVFYHNGFGPPAAGQVLAYGWSLSVFNQCF